MAASGRFLGNAQPANGDNRLPAQLLSEEMIEYTIMVWSPYYFKKLSREEAAEIIQNAAALADFLKEMKEGNK